MAEMTPHTSKLTSTGSELTPSTSKLTPARNEPTYSDAMSKIESTSIAAKLKNCPLCDGLTISRIAIDVRPNPGFNLLKLTVRCTKCGCSRTTDIEICDTSFDEVVRAISKATDEWNRRVENG